MDQRPHLFPTETGSIKSYTSARRGGSSEFPVPPRDRVPHSNHLVHQVESAKQQAQELSASAVAKPAGIVLEVRSDPEFQLKLKSLEFEPSGIRLLNSHVEPSGVMRAAVFIPTGKVENFIRKFKDFADPAKNTKKDKPKNHDLVASISEIRLAALESFWTDSESFPTNRSQPTWWEVWLHDSEKTPRANTQDVVDEFRLRAEATGAMVGDRVLKFPDRRVVLVRASVAQLVAIENLFDLLAELRAAKILASEFLDLAPRDQAEFIDDALNRIRPPSIEAPAVCHLDTGVNRGHPLLAIALHSDHLLAVDPSWSPADGHRHQHGTGMAGLALYGCLTQLLNGTQTVQLTHRLESVKILPDHGEHEPDLYGDVTAQSVARIEIAAPDRQQRAFAMTVTADSRDAGLPSSWSAALDQILSGADDEGRPSRLMFVSAGNTFPNSHHEYPDRNHTQGVEDPAQSWNAVTVGAYTDKTTIHSAEYRAWEPVANAGQLCPSSRTSLIWEERSWPIKPDIVMEGGNLAAHPNTGETREIDDLQLLTTYVSPTGAMLTTTGETSAATALAARYAAMIWARYPHLTAESVRGLLIHSARWTAPMLSEFPHKDRHNRLRVYGYGVPDLNRAMWSAQNNATLIMEAVLQPFGEVVEDSGEKKIKTKDMQLHRLPWPKEVLEQLGSTTVRLRVTLSYFIEPSPGRRGWKDKHRYQSHGLRFQRRMAGSSTESASGSRSSHALESGLNNETSTIARRHGELKGSVSPGCFRHSPNRQGAGLL